MWNPFKIFKKKIKSQEVVKQKPPARVFKTIVYEIDKETGDSTFHLEGKSLKVSGEEIKIGTTEFLRRKLEEFVGNDAFKLKQLNEEFKIKEFTDFYEKNY